MQIIGLTGQYTGEIKQIFLPEQDAKARQAAVDQGLNADLMVIRVLSTERLRGQFPLKTDASQDASNLRLLADWFDSPSVQKRFSEWHDSHGNERSNKVQRELRRIATTLEEREVD